MDSYHIALFLHLSALLAATATSALVHFIESRMRAASTSGEVRQWIGLLGKVTVAFPVASLTLVATGVYMVIGVFPWHTGWIEVGLAGIVLLMVLGGTVGRRGRLLERALEQSSDGPVTAEIAALVRDPIARTFTWMNTALALGIVYIMVMKTSLVGSITAVAIAVWIGALVAKGIQRADRKKRAGALAAAA